MSLNFSASSNGSVNFVADENNVLPVAHVLEASSDDENNSDELINPLSHYDSSLDGENSDFHDYILNTTNSLAISEGAEKSSGSSDDTNINTTDGHVSQGNNLFTAPNNCQVSADKSFQIKQLYAADTSSGQIPQTDSLDPKGVGDIAAGLTNGSSGATSSNESVRPLASVSTAADDDNDDWLLDFEILAPHTTWPVPEYEIKKEPGEENAQPVTLNIIYDDDVEIIFTNNFKMPDGFKIEQETVDEVTGTLKYAVNINNKKSIKHPILIYIFLYNFKYLQISPRGRIFQHKRQEFLISTTVNDLLKYYNVSFNVSGLDFKVVVLFILAIADQEEVYSGQINEKARSFINLLFTIRTSDVIRFERYVKIWPYALTKAKEVYEKRKQVQQAERK